MAWEGKKTQRMCYRYNPSGESRLSHQVTDSAVTQVTKDTLVRKKNPESFLGMDDACVCASQNG